MSDKRQNLFQKLDPNKLKVGDIYEYDYAADGKFLEVVVYKINPQSVRFQFKCDGEFLTIPKNHAISWESGFKKRQSQHKARKRKAEAAGSPTSSETPGKSSKKRKGQHARSAENQSNAATKIHAIQKTPVSYTHLTLPTIYSV